MEQKKVDTTFLKGEDILNASEVVQFFLNVYDEKYKEAEKKQIVVFILRFVYRPDPLMYIVKKIQGGYILYEVRWETETAGME